MSSVTIDLLPISNAKQVPYYLSEGTAWTVNDSGIDSNAVNNLFLTHEPSYKNIGYQAYNQSNLVTDPNSLGGLWFGKRSKKVRRVSKKARKVSKKARKVSKKAHKVSKKARKNAMGTVRTMGPRMVTPGAITTQDGWGFKNMQ